MKTINYFYLVLLPLLLSGGQFCFKKASMSVVFHSFTRFLISVVTNQYFWIALFIYGMATLLWLFILSRVPLSKAIPFIALTYVIVPVMAAVFFDEKLHLMYWMGVLIIIAGVYIAASNVSAA